jgi:hypothetical protein
MGDKIKKTKSDRMIGDLIVAAWRAAKDSVNDPFVVDGKKLAQDLVQGGYIDPSDTIGGTKKKIVFDVVFDTDLDGDNRLVWIAIPTPDVPPTQTDWENYINGLTDADIRKLAESVLFGCGR